MPENVLMWLEKIKKDKFSTFRLVMLIIKIKLLKLLKPFILKREKIKIGGFCVSGSSVNQRLIQNDSKDNTNNLFKFTK